MRDDKQKGEGRTAEEVGDENQKRWRQKKCRETKSRRGEKNSRRKWKIKTEEVEDEKRK